MPQRSTTAPRAARQDRPAPVPVERALAQREATEAHPLIVAIEKRMPVIATILPASMDAARFQSIVISAVVQNPDLLTCEPASVIDAIVTAAREGLEPTGASGGAWLVPFYDKGVRKAQLIRDYRGIAKLLIAGGTVKRIDTSPVRTGDEFEYELGMNPRLVHKPKVGNDAEAHSFYAIAWMPDSDLPKVEVMTRGQVEHIRDKTKSRDREGKIVGPWATDFDQMGRKTVMKRLANNQLPINHEVRAQLAAEDVAEFGDGVVIERVPATDLTERRAAIAGRTARLTGGTQQPEQEPTAAAAKGSSSPSSAGQAPAPAPKKDEAQAAPEPSLEDAQAAVHAAAVERGLIPELPKDESSAAYEPALAANWKVLDGFAAESIPDTKPADLTARDLVFLRERIAAGDFDGAKA